MTITLNATNDGNAQKNSNVNYVTHHSGVGDNFVNNDTTDYYIRTDVVAHATNGLFDYNQRGLVTFDGSAIPDGAVINSATILFTKNTVSNTFGDTINISLVDATPANLSEYAAADYNQTTFNRVATDLPITSADKTFTLNATGISKINKTGKFAFMIMNSFDTDGQEITWGASQRCQIKFKSVTSGYAPQMTVDYTPPAVSDFTSNITNRDAPLIITFNNTSASTMTAWNWSYTNTTPGNNTEIYHATTENITLTLERGNWLINLNASSATEFNISSHWMNVSYDSADRLDITGFPNPYYPTNHLYNVPIDKMPIDPNSTDMITNNWGTAGKLYAGFGNHYAGGFDTGCGYDVVDSTLDKTTIIFSETDGFSTSNQYPIVSPEPHIQGEYDIYVDGCTSDCQLFVYDTDTTDLYELAVLNTRYDNGTLGAMTGGIFNRTNYTISADTGQGAAGAAGMPLFPLHIRYDEVASGEIKHALGMHISYTRSTPNKIWPASWGGANLVNVSVNYPEHGTRFRLNNTTDISGYSPANQVILTAMKKYGVFILGETDTNAIHAWALKGERDSRWNHTDLGLLNGINGTSLEAIDESSLMITVESGQVNMTALGLYQTELLPTASFTKSRSIVRIPQTVTFTDTSTNTPTSRSWDLGDRSPAKTTQNITYRYYKPGTYTINLTSTNAAGTDYYIDKLRVMGRNYRIGVEDIRKYSCEEMSYSVSKELSDYEIVMTDEKILKLCEV